MNPVKLYYLHFENYKIYISRIKGKNKSLLFNRVPLLNHIHADWLQTVIYKACIVLEPLASLIMVTVCLFPWCVKALLTKRNPISEILYFDTTPLLKGRTISAGKYEESVDWIYSMDISKKTWDQTKRCHSLFEYVNVWNVILSYFLSVAAILGAQTKLHFKFLFRTYNSFEFFIAYYTLKNLTLVDTLCFCNQMDRWGVLFDHAPQKNKVLFQHGIEMPTANWPIRFENTDTVYTFSEEESELLLRAEFKNKPQHIYILGPTIQLTKMVDDNGFKILIIGFPGYLMYDKEKAIVDAFNVDGCIVYLKPHPGKEDMTTYLNLEKENTHCRIILEKKFPDVDVVVSYRSTLAIEYQAYKKTVLFYADYSIDEIINKIKELQKKA